MEIIINGNKTTIDIPASVYDAVKLAGGVPRNAIAAEIISADGVRTVGLTHMLDEDCEVRLLTFADESGRDIYRHTASHILAQAVKRLYPGVKLTIGPAIDNGFYYDFDSEESFTPEILEKIEAEMKKIIKENHKIERFTLPRDRAAALADEMGEPYKAELIAELPEGEEISFYRQGEFTDLCAGPHMHATGAIKAFKLLQCTGAYWRGDQNNKMLQRVYGTAFPKKEELDAHLAALEEAKKRDHNKLGRELEYFTTVDYIGQGLPILMPKGARVIQLLQRFVEDEEERRGYLLTRTPILAKRDLYKISGHWEHYRDGMFIMGDPDGDGEVFAMRPMTCPFQFQVYLTKSRSYRDLPMRFAETATLFRNESSGEMHGLIRVRQFTISEGHIACRPDQLEEEFSGCLELARFMLSAIGLEEDVSYRFSKWDKNNREKYIGSEDEWENVQIRMKDILDKIGLKYSEAEGEAAFYGPKLDIQIKNVFGKEDTIITLQIDFQLAERFGMEYTDADGQKKHPYVIHRTSIGCYERTLALLIEKYAGALPLWLAPTQVMVMTITEDEAQLAYAKTVYDKLRAAGIRAESDMRREKIGYKIRQAQLSKIPYMLIIGAKEAASSTVSLRGRNGTESSGIILDELIEQLLKEISDKHRS